MINCNFNDMKLFYEKGKYYDGIYLMDFYLESCTFNIDPCVIEVGLYFKAYTVNNKVCSEFWPVTDMKIGIARYNIYNNESCKANGFLQNDLFIDSVIEKNGSYVEPHIPTEEVILDFIKQVEKKCFDKTVLTTIIPRENK